MNGNIDLNRRPLREVVFKHGSSKLFFRAIVLSIVSTAVSILLNIFNTFSTLNSSLVSEFDYFSTDGYIILIFLMLGINVINGIIALIQNGYLLSAYNYFSGKSTNPNGLKSYLKLMLVNLVVISIEIPFVVILSFGTAYYESGIVSSNAASIVATALIASLIFIVPIIAGAIVFYVFFYKGVKKTFIHTYAALDDRNVGRLSPFVLVVTIIIASFTAISLLTSIPTFFIASLFSIKGIILILTTFVAALPLISYILYIILMFRYKKDMEYAGYLWYHIQEKRASIRAQEYASAQSSDNTLDNAQ